MAEAVRNPPYGTKINNKVVGINPLRPGLYIAHIKQGNATSACKFFVTKL